jgi:hypothetical protein
MIVTSKSEQVGNVVLTLVWPLDGVFLFWEDVIAKKCFRGKNPPKAIPHISLIYVKYPYNLTLK